MPTLSSGITATGLGFAVGVVVLVLGWAAVLTRATGPHSTEALRERWQRYLSLAHTFLGATAAVAALAWFARRSAVTDGAGMVVRYPWLPWWGAALAWVATMAVLVVAARRVSPDRLEAAMVRLVVGSVFVYVVTSQVASQIGPDPGLRRHAERDRRRPAVAWLLPVAGLPVHPRTLRGRAAQLGRVRPLRPHAVGDHTPPSAMLWIPLTWVGVYWIGVWASAAGPRRCWRSCALICGRRAHIGPSYRWVAMGLVFVLLGEALRRSQLAVDRADDRRAVRRGDPGPRGVRSR